MVTKTEQKRIERAQWRADGWIYFGAWIKPKWKPMFDALKAKLTKREQK